MVLRPALAVVVLCGCVRPAPVVRAGDGTAAALLLLCDQEHGSEVLDVPPVLAESVAAQLVQRNIVPERAAVASFGAFAVVRDSERRMSRLLETAETPLAVLVETKAVYSSPMNGRYRWSVYARLTASRRERPPISGSVEVSTFLDFEHEREREALAAAAPAIADRLGAMLDELLTD